MKKLLLLILLFVAIGCAEPTCEELTVDYRAAVDATNEEWDDAVDIANSTARMSLSGPLSELQRINRDAKQIDVPECAADAHEAWLEYQELTIDAFVAFLGQEDESVITGIFEDAGDALTQWVIRYGGLIDEPAGPPE